MKPIIKLQRGTSEINKLRTKNQTLRIKYEGIKKLLEKQDKEINKLHSIIKENNNIKKIDENDRNWHYTYNSKTTSKEVVDNLEILREKINMIIDCLNKEKE